MLFCVFSRTALPLFIAIRDALHAYCTSHLLMMHFSPTRSLFASILTANPTFNYTNVRSLVSVLSTER
jgi:hypothetical protein